MKRPQIKDLGNFPINKESNRIEWSGDAMRAIREKHKIAISPWESKTIPIAQIKIDRRYQRKTDQRAAFNLVYEEGFNATACGAVDAVLRNDDFYYVWDGGHRVAMAELAGLAFIAASVTKGLTPEEEAKAFILRNAKNRKISKVDLYRAGLFTGEPHYIMMCAALAAANLEVDTDD